MLIIITITIIIGCAPSLKCPCEVTPTFPTWSVQELAES